MFKEFNSLLELITVFPMNKLALNIWNMYAGKEMLFLPMTHHPRCTNARGIIISARIQVNISMRKQVQCFIGPRFRCKNGLWLFGWSLPIRKAYLPCS